MFCEADTFTAEESRQVLEAGLKYGLRPKIAEDEMGMGVHQAGRDQVALGVDDPVRRGGGAGPYLGDEAVFHQDRNWAGNPNSMTTVAEYNELYAGQDHITMPYLADDALVAEAVKGMKG